MPGVSEVHVSYTKSFEQGATLDIGVFLPDVTAREIADVVSRINDITAIPVSVHELTVGPLAMITGITVVLRSRKTAYDDLVSVMRNTTGAGSGHEVLLSWFVDDQATGQPRFTGSVDVAGCNYPNTPVEHDPDKYLTPDALALQRRLREEFDHCPR